MQNLAIIGFLWNKRWCGSFIFRSQEGLSKDSNFITYTKKPQKYTSHTLRHWWDCWIQHNAGLV